MNRPLFQCILITLIAIITYSNTFDVPFVFDDTRFVKNNPLIREFGYFIDPAKAGELCLEDDVSWYFKTRRVGFLSFWANYRLGGLKVWGFHAVNLALHIITALLVYLIVSLSFRTPFLENSRLRDRASLVALFSGLLFVAHPMQTEAVTYILQRIVLLTATFYLASTAAYIGSRLSGGRARYALYALALVFAVFGMKTKENAFTLPVAIGLYEFMFFRGGIKKKALLLLPLLLTMLIIPVQYMDTDMYATLSDSLEIATARPKAPQRIDYLYTQFSVVASYMRLLVFPTGQNVDHDQVVYHSPFEPRVAMSFLFLLVVVGFGVYLYNRSRTADSTLRLPAFGIFWFFIAISVESSVLPIWLLMVEYRVYLPSVGFLIALGSGAFLLMEKVRARAAQTAVVSLIVIMPIVLSFAAYSRNSVWQSALTLWEDSAEKSHQRARPHVNLANELIDRGEMDRAIRHLEIAAELEPETEITYNSLGVAYLSKGMTDKAIENFRTAVRLKHFYPEAHENLAIAYASKGMTGKAEEHFRTALGLKQDDTDIYYSIGITYTLKGMTDEAIEQFEKAISSNPGHADAYYALGAAYASRGMTDKAIEHYRSAVRSNPNHADAHYNLGVAYAYRGMTDDALMHYEDAVRIRPDYGKAHINLGIIYKSRGFIDRAIEHYGIALGLMKDNAEIHNNLGNAYDAKGLTDKAIEHYKKALELNPDYAGAHFNLGLVYLKNGQKDKARGEFQAALKINPGFQKARRFLDRISVHNNP
jgi:tetratricopeptide (TPR) repeat protein